jgi:hypothetical protein
MGSVSGHLDNGDSSSGKVYFFCVFDTNIFTRTIVHYYMHQRKLHKLLHFGVMLSICTKLNMQWVLASFCTTFQHALHIMEWHWDHM